MFTVFCVGYTFVSVCGGKVLKIGTVTWEFLLWLIANREQQCILLTGTFCQTNLQMLCTRDINLLYLFSDKFISQKSCPGCSVWM